jgi:MFS family permease
VEESRAPAEGQALDARGQLAGVVFLVALVGALIEGRHLGWSAPPIVAAFAIAAAALAALLAVERGARHPMLDLRYFRNAGFSAANAGAGLMNLGVLGALFVLSLLLQQRHGYSPEATGLRVLPLAAPLAVLPLVVGRLIERGGPRLPAALGLAGTGVGFAVLAALGADAGYGSMLVPLLLAGISLGFATPGVVTGATASVTPERAGMAAAVNNTARQFGGAVGVALIGGIAGAGAFAVGAAALFALVAAGIGASGTFTRTTTLQYVAQHELYGLIALLLVVPAVFGDHRTGLVRRVLRHRVLAWLGLISYGIFLYHHPVMEALADSRVSDAWSGFPMLGLTVTGLVPDHGAVQLELWRMRGPSGRPELYAALPAGCGISVSISADASHGVCNYTHVESDLYVATNFDAARR